MWVTDKKGQKVYVTSTPDCGENEGGLYCETYTDDRCDRKIDDFCIHKGDCELTQEGIKEYIKDHYKDEVLDLSFNFDGAPANNLSISRQLYEKLTSQWYEVANIAMGCDMDNIREVFGDRITNDTGDCIDVNYKDILVTFTAQKGISRGYDTYGGKAFLNDKFEYYNKGGVFCGRFNLAGEEV